MTSEDTKDSPDIISCPPLVYLGALGLGLLMDWLFPVHWLLSESWQVAGGILGATGTVIGFWGVHAFHRAGTNVRPDRPVIPQRSGALAAKPSPPERRTGSGGGGAPLRRPKRKP